MPHAVDRRFDFAGHCQPPIEVVNQQAHGYAADKGHCPACGRKVGEERVDARARLGEEAHEDGNLREERDTRDEQHQQRVDDALRDNGSDGFGKRHAVVVFQHAASREFAHARHNEAHGIGEEHGIDRGFAAWMLVHRC